MSPTISQNMCFSCHVPFWGAYGWNDDVKWNKKPDSLVCNQANFHFILVVGWPQVVTVVLWSDNRQFLAVLGITSKDF